MIDELTKTFYGNKRCNDNISELLSEEQIGIMQDNVENQFQKVLDALLIDLSLIHISEPTRPY